MMHPRTEHPEPGVPAYITAFRADLAKAAGRVPAAVLKCAAIR